MGVFDGSSGPEIHVGLRVDLTFGSLLGFLLGALDFVVGAVGFRPRIRLFVNLLDQKLGKSHKGQNK